VKLETQASLVESWQSGSELKPSYHFGNKFQGYCQEKLLMDKQLYNYLDTFPVIPFLEPISVHLPDGTVVSMKKL
jgi:hypothetical protein